MCISCRLSSCKSVFCACVASGQELAESHPGQHGVNRGAEANRPVVHLPPAGGESGQVKTGNSYPPLYTHFCNCTVGVHFKIWLSEKLHSCCVSTPLRVTEEVTAKLLKSAYHQIERDGILATRLCTHKDDVELTNENKLKQLPGAICYFQVFIELDPVKNRHNAFICLLPFSVINMCYTFCGVVGGRKTELTSSPSGSVRVFEALDSDPALVKTIDTHSPVGRIIQLKVGAQVPLFCASSQEVRMIGHVGSRVVTFWSTQGHADKESGHHSGPGERSAWSRGGIRFWKSGSVFVGHKYQMHKRNVLTFFHHRNAAWASPILS